MSELFTVPAGGRGLAAERWPGGAQVVVLLHEGVSDRRGWREVAGYLSPEARYVAVLLIAELHQPKGSEDQRVFV